MEISLGFELVGEDMEGTRADLSDAGPGALFPIDQDTFEPADDDFEMGDHAGWVHGTAVLTHRDRLVCQLTFSFEADPEDSIVVHGVLPREGDRCDPDDSRSDRAGPGGSTRRAGTLAVRTQNPKRSASPLTRPAGTPPVPLRHLEQRLAAP